MEDPRISPAKLRSGREIILFPLPLQGHVTPMLQLANILYSRGFSITIVHTHLNSPKSSSYPHFDFQPIPDGLLEGQASVVDFPALVTLMNVTCVGPFRDCLAKLLSDASSKDWILCCLITDAVWHFTQAVADELRVPRTVLRTSSISSFLAFCALPLMREKGYIPLQANCRSKSTLGDHGGYVEPTVSQFPRTVIFVEQYLFLWRHHRESFVRIKSVGRDLERSGEVTGHFRKALHICVLTCHAVCRQLVFGLVHRLRPLCLSIKAASKKYRARRRLFPDSLSLICSSLLRRFYRQVMAKSPDQEHPHKAFGWAARDKSGLLSPFHFSRRENGDEDVTIKILFCGVCHSDLHTAKNEWGFTNYPVVPGHEIVGTVIKLGSNVKKFKVGERVGVGTRVGSCKKCESCLQDLENYCPQTIYTYSSHYTDGTKTYGGFSDIIVVDEHYVLRFPDNLPSEGGAPLLCAGITVYSPMKYYGMTEPGKHLGVAGLGGLGHVAVKIGKAFGLKVTVISSSPKKEAEAIERLGADSFLVTSDPTKMKAALGTMDYIIDTVSAVHPLLPLLSLLKVNGKLVTVGLPDKPQELPIFPLVMGRKLVGGSDVGGMKETQEMLDFCAKHGIAADVEVIRMDYINTAMERLAKSDVRYRFVIDVASSLSQ